MIELEEGDIVANKFGHVMCIRHLEGEEAVCFYECNPTAFHRYKVGEVRLLSKTKGVDMSCWNSGLFMETIRRQAEWAKKVHGMPREREERQEKRDVKKLAELPTADLFRMLMEGKKK